MCKFVLPVLAFGCSVLPSAGPGWLLYFIVIVCWRPGPAIQNKRERCNLITFYAYHLIKQDIRQGTPAAEWLQHHATHTCALASDLDPLMMACDPYTACRWQRDLCKHRCSRVQRHVAVVCLG